MRRASPAHASAGDRAALDGQFSAAYDELRRLAAAVKRADPNATVTPTTLVNEAWVKLAKSPRFVATSALHFKRIAARAMRQVLIEAARRRLAHKRGHNPVLVTFDESTDSIAPGATADDLLALDRALTQLGALHPRQAALVEGRFFGGLDVGELSTLLDVSEATVLRDWRTARAWLAAELTP
jgi:RNA polymerase sigma factor (TIGR02999 family)